MKRKPDNSYLIPERLSDVIRLIVVLAVDKHSFRSENGLQSILHSPPNSALTWLILAKDHQEFFKFNSDGTSIVLLIRFLQKVEVAGGEVREPLTVDQTQKLVDQAIDLHDKQLARYQMDSAKSAIQAAYIAALATVLVGVISYFTSIDANKDLKTDIEIIKTQLQHFEKSDNLEKASNPMIVKTDTLSNKASNNSPKRYRKTNCNGKKVTKK